MNRFLFSLISVVLVALTVSAQSIVDLDRQRAEWILDAFNQSPQNLLEPLTLDAIRIVNGVGRVEVNRKAKFSYYVQTENAKDPQSPILLIPMATSRFSPTYYQTDEWWDAHKDMKPMPKQPMDEVMAWLREMKLSTNPDVLVVRPSESSRARIERQPLQNFLLKVYLSKYIHNGKVVLYRGAEKDNEPSIWRSGQRPPGVRYWTPTANYAWRYARKNTKFIEMLVNGEAPLLKFEVPIEEFQNMVQGKWPMLTLGTELTKNAHSSFTSYGKFQDHLTSPQSDYMGEGQYGVEFEIRSNKQGADNMGRHYKGSIGIHELAQDRMSVIRQTLTRIKRQRPDEAEALEKAAAVRLQTIAAEEEILLSIQKKQNSPRIQELARRFSGRGELTAIDGFAFQYWALQKLQNLPMVNDPDLAESKVSSSRGLSCLKAHL